MSSETENAIELQDILPEGITPAQNGIIPANYLKKIHCGGYLYVDAARSWLAMLRAASMDHLFLSVNNPFNTYRTIIQQNKTFMSRFFEVVDAQDDIPDDAIQVDYDDKVWQLKKGKVFIAPPGQSLHGFGLAVFIANSQRSAVSSWLEKNAEQFGFVRGTGVDERSFIYVKSRQGIPERVLEIESLPPEPRFSAKQIASYSGCKWVNPPQSNWSCNGIFSSKPFKAGALAVIDQGSGIGVGEDNLPKIHRQCAGFICSDPGKLEQYKLPMLVTSNVKETIQKLNDGFQKALTEKPPVKKAEAVANKIPFVAPKGSDPETKIFYRKKSLAAQLLEITVEELSDAHEQPWYDEYLSLFAIRIQKGDLIEQGKIYCEELLKWYNEHVKESTRELAVLGLIQFMEPVDLTVPFNQNLWSAEMRTDVQSVILDQFMRVGYTDADISDYYLERQTTWRHGKRKPRVVFLFHSSAKGDKIMPVYEAMSKRDDIETLFVTHPSSDYHYGERYWKYFHERFPGNKIYNATGLADLRRLKPDYVFYQNPYDRRRPFASFHINDVIRFAKVCHISYGASLAYTFIKRLFDDFPQFYRSINLMFCSAETVKEKLIERVPENVEKGYQHIEFLGYPILDLPPVELVPSEKKRILWTPRWSYSARVGGSHFMEYKDKFIELADRYGDKAKFAMRPHMNTFRYLTKTGMITKEEVDAYKELVKSKGIKLYSTFVDVEENFSEADILLGDYSSILIVYFLTGRPMIYCEFPNAKMFPEYEEMLNCMYVAHNWGEVEHYVEELLSGNDPLFERRQKAIKKIRADHANATQRIIDRVLEDFNSCLDLTSND